MNKRRAIDKTWKSEDKRRSGESDLRIEANAFTVIARWIAKAGARERFEMRFAVGVQDDYED